MLYVLLNGPSKSGKSTIIRPMFTDILTTAGYRVHHDSFAAPMKNFIAVLAGAASYDVLAKDTPSDVFAGDTPRQALIDLSERHIKPKYGSGFYGNSLASRCDGAFAHFVIADDSGFDEEAEPLYPRYVVGVRRPGTSFEGDSRRYLNRIDTWLDNDCDMDALRTRIALICSVLVETVNHGNLS